VAAGKVLFVSLGVFCAALAAAKAGAVHFVQNPPMPISRPANLSDEAPDLASPSEKAANAAADPTGAADEFSSARQNYRALLRREAWKTGLPPDIAEAVTAIESGYDPTVVGGVGEIGLMQVRPETAEMMGFKGNLAELAKPEVNIHYGVSYLAEAWRLANGDLCRALMKYRAGHGEEDMTPLSVSYCGRARAHLAALGSPFAAGALAVPIVFGPISHSAHPVRRSPRIRTEAVSRAFWAAQEAKVKAITARIEAKWRKVALR
jgi:soluble lytic murein transglycosylase-like protein